MFTDKKVFKCQKKVLNSTKLTVYITNIINYYQGGLVEDWDG